MFARTRVLESHLLKNTRSPSTLELVSGLRPPPQVSAHVLSQVAGRRERVAARRAGMRFPLRLHLRIEVAGLRKCRHGMGSPLRVRPPVPSQGAGVGVRHATLLADMRFLPRMRPHMLSQVASARGAGKLFAAHLAGVRSPRCVPRIRLLRAHVHFKLAGT